MASKKSLLSTTAFPLALGVGLVTIPHLPTLASSQPAALGNKILSFWQVSLTSEPPIAKKTAPVSTLREGTRIFEPPNGKAPSTIGGGTRGKSCIKNQNPNENHIIPLMPTKNLVLTVSEYPTFFLYLPESRAQTATFVLRDEDQNDPVYETTFNIPNKPGIVSLALPSAALPPLKVGKMYVWTLNLVCNSEDKLDPYQDSFDSKPDLVAGWIERIAPSDTLAAKLEKTSVRDRPRVYGKAGIWQETLTTLAQLRRSNPNDAKIRADWEKLLNEVGLSAVAKEPLVDCCTVEN